MFTQTECMLNMFLFYFNLVNVAFFSQNMLLTTASSNIQNCPGEYSADLTNILQSLISASDSLSICENPLAHVGEFINPATWGQHVDPNQYWNNWAHTTTNQNTDPWNTGATNTWDASNTWNTGNTWNNNQWEQT